MKAQVKAESGFNTFASSHSGAKGLAQFIPSTWQEWGQGSIHDPEESIKAQSRYLAYLLPIFDNQLDLALASYNWGMGNLMVLIKDTNSWEIEVLKSSGRFPKETALYIDRVKKYYEDYKTHGKEINE